MLEFFRRGLIPGPHESEEAFFKRVESHPRLISPEWDKLAPLQSDLCGFSIDWVPIIYSTKKLLPWEAAVFWVQENQSFIQLRPSLQTKNLFGNSSTEILLHEAVHAAREAFNESTFEEFLAYSVSPSRFKRWLGPLFKRPWEFPLFTIALFFLPLIPLISGPALAIFLGLFFYQHFCFRRLKKKFPFPVLLCLTDQEIRTGRIVPDGSPRSRLIESLLQQSEV